MILEYRMLYDTLIVHGKLETLHKSLKLPKQVHAQNICIISIGAIRVYEVFSQQQNLAPLQPYIPKHKQYHPQPQLYEQLLFGQQHPGSVVSLGKCI